MASITQPKKRKCEAKSIETKYQALMLVKEGKMKKSEIAKKFEIPANTLSTWLKSKDKIIESYESSEFGPSTKKMRTAMYPEVEKALDLWFKEARSQNIPISGPILQVKAKDLSRKLGLSDF